MAIDLRSFTPARVALGRTGHSLPTAELLRFRLDHARARDAVYQPLDPQSLGVPHQLLTSAAGDRATYLQRPDLGRRLSRESRQELVKGDYEAALVIADGLSAPAVHRHAVPLLEALRPYLADWRMAPLSVVLQGRVAIGDEIGELLGAKLVVMMIGERPGLTSPDSLGIYLTWDPRPGRTDAERNCISNVHTEGIGYEVAARQLSFLMQQARLRRISGIHLSTTGYELA
ncbi:MAG TPA: ethanolamine ammonia-lyase subunit EutC [Bryobacteraceae bacterium]|nr:ethanolamine ammonia-lyase subunit EutC [Bryobacteraceae bacterium]